MPPSWPGNETVLDLADRVTIALAPKVDPSGACLYAALGVMAAAHVHGRRLVLQAGTAEWPRLRPDQDDGRADTPTHFGYVWDPDAPLTRAWVAGIRPMTDDAQAVVLPEVHCWAGDPERQELVDPTSGRFPEQCRRLVGLDWPGDRPLRRTWLPVAEVHRLGAVYVPDERATRLLAALVADRSRQAVTIARDLRMSA